MRSMFSKAGMGSLAAAALVVLPAGPIQAASETNAVCYTEATFRLSQGLTDEPNDTTFHSVGDGTVRCFGTVEGQTLTGEVGTFSASGQSSSTSCTTGSGSFLGKARIPTADGAVSFGVRVSFTRVGLTGTASGELISTGTPLKGAFAAQPLDGDCRHEPVDEVTIRVAAEIGA